MESIGPLVQQPPGTCLYRVRLFAKAHIHVGDRRLRFVPVNARHQRALFDHLVGTREN
jgi:hypothetical protein